MNVSVVVPIQIASPEFAIYLEHLPLCIEALRYQTEPCQIVLVNYNSAPQYASRIEAIGKKCKCVHYQCEDKIWSRGRSLNVGIRNSYGELILFVDSDCIAPKYYTEKHLEAIGGEGAKFTFSKFWNTTQAINTSGDYEKLMEQKSCLLPPLADCCSHQGFRRTTLQKFGLFDEEYRGWGAEDNDLFLRMKRAGVHPVEVDAKLVHLWHPTWQEMMNNAGRSEEQKTSLEINRQRFFTYKKTGQK